MKWLLKFGRQKAHAWEQRKAKEIFISTSEKNHAYLPVISATQDKGMVYRDDVGIDIKYDKKTLAFYKLVRSGQFVIHLRSFQGGFAFSEIEGITSPVIPPKRAASKSRINTSPAFSAGRVSLLKPSYAFALE